jgi:hypothetical protein
VWPHPRLFDRADGPHAQMLADDVGHEPEVLGVSDESLAPRPSSMKLVQALDTVMRISPGWMYSPPLPLKRVNDDARRSHGTPKERIVDVVP